MVTVSTSTGPNRAYHHGDLRTALVAAGLVALETTPIGELSLRQLARDVGVSATAVYRHFPDKKALLGAMANAGIAMLGQFQKNAAEASQDEVAAFIATGRAYVRFALAQPALFRLIFSHIEPIGETVFGQSLAARMLQDHAAAATADPAEARRLVIQAWAVVHGLAMLMLDGQLPRDDALIDQVIDPGSLFGGRLSGRSSEESP